MALRDRILDKVEEAPFIKDNATRTRYADIQYTNRTDLIAKLRADLAIPRTPMAALLVSEGGWVTPEEMEEVKDLIDTEEDPVVRVRVRR